jgi:hypothetical protein
MMRSIGNIRVALALTVLIGAGVGIFAAERGTSSPAQTPGIWPTSPPGKAIAGDDLVRGQALRSGISVDSLHQVATTGGDRWGTSLLSGSDSVTGRVCVALHPWGAIGPFDCLDSTGSQNDAIIERTADGGQTATVVDHASVVGLARSDVTRVSAKLDDGLEIDLHLDAQNAFAFRADRPDAMPVSLTAYNAQGALLQTVDLHVGPEG